LARHSLGEGGLVRFNFEKKNLIKVFLFNLQMQNFYLIHQDILPLCGNVNYFAFIN